MDQLPFQIPPDVAGFLQLVITPTFGAWTISAFAEQEVWFLNLTSAWKSRAVFIMLWVLSIVGRLGLASMYGQPFTVQDLYIGTTVAFIAYVSSRWYHVRFNDPTPKTSQERAITAAVKAAKLPDPANTTPPPFNTPFPPATGAPG